MYEIYEKPDCMYCVKAKKLLKENNLEYTTISAVVNKKHLIERVTESTGNPPKTVPQIFFDGEYIGGYDQLCLHLSKTN